MKSSTTRRFWESYERLPAMVQRRARKAYELFEHDPSHPSLHFKKVHATQPIYSARINLDYRAVGILKGAEILWSWIGSHEDYERLLAPLTALISTVGLRPHDEIPVSETEPVVAAQVENALISSVGLRLRELFLGLGDVGELSVGNALISTVGW